MSRTEVLKEWFFPVPSLKIDGVYIGAPKEALEIYYQLKKDWLIPHPELPHEDPEVDLRPGKKEDQEGFFVRTEIRYR